MALNAILGGAGLALQGISLLSGKKSADKEADAIEDQAEEHAALLKKRGLEQFNYNKAAADQVMAVGRLNASEEKREAKLIASRAVAVAAAGGSVQNMSHLIADVYGEGAYRAQLVLYDYELEADRLNYEGLQAKKYGYEQATAATNAGKGAASATRKSALGRAINQAGSMLISGAKLYSATATSA